MSSSGNAYSNKKVVISMFIVLFIIGISIIYLAFFNSSIHHRVFIGKTSYANGIAITLLELDFANDYTNLAFRVEDGGSNQWIPTISMITPNWVNDANHIQTASYTDGIVIYHIEEKLVQDHGDWVVSVDNIMNKNLIIIDGPWIFRLQVPVINYLMTRSFLENCLTVSGVKD